MKKAVYIVIFVLFAMLPLQAKADEQATIDSLEGQIPIYSLDDLLAVKNNPDGDYILMTDLDLTGVDWEPIDFTGSFDGNNHAILNLKITKLSSETRTSIDGNRKPYPTHFAGFFGVIEEATIKNLNIFGAEVSMEYNENVFLGILCGYTLNSTIENCNVQGLVSLTTSAKQHGVAGLCGYGTNYYKGYIKNCSADVTLINVDTDLKDKDEEFMAGIVCIGYSKIYDCSVIIDGYISDHGYVHSGGITGLFIKDTNEQVIQGVITGCTVKGRIRFFEDNTNRRAYCAGIIGEKFTRCENMTGNNSEGFVRDEIFTYDKNLYPHADCDCEEYTITDTASGCTEYGYTLSVCNKCGYSTKKNFKLLNHTLSAPLEIITSPSLESAGFGKYECSTCSATVYADIPMLTPTPTPTPLPTATPLPTEAPTAATSISPTSVPEDTEGSSPAKILLPAILTLVIILASGLVHTKRKM